jgi:VIT1/CCC1 family predicted Fe2+/Mn2+ transporter
MLIGALGCNLAWGIIDGILYLMECLAVKGANLTAFRAIRSTLDPQQASRQLADVLPPVIASVLSDSELESVHQRLRRLPDPPERATLSREDWIGGVAVFLLVFLSTLPVAVPFMVMQNAVPALRVSNGIAIAMLFVAGTIYGRTVGRRPWMIGISMVLLGGLLSALTIALGG